MSRKRKRQSSPCHVSYEIDTSKKAYDDIITFPNPDVSGSDASDFDTYWGDEISDLTYKKTTVRSEKSKEETGFFNISKKKKKVVKKSSSSKQQQQQQQPPAVKEKNVKIDGDENADDESSTRVSPVIESPIIGEVKPIDSVPPNITKESASKEDLDIVATVVLSDQQQQEQQQPPTLKDNNVKSDDERSAKDSPVIQSPRISESKSKEFVPSCTSKEGASEEDLDITATVVSSSQQEQQQEQ
uniref:Uncharacterized protein n=1 Tax=Trichogramma kaykai TaxID=54128 RepID=A0ABD2XL62_9HYME